MARGHIRERGQALEVRVFAGQVDGRKRYLTRTIRWQGSKKATRKLAEAELTKLLGELDDGAHTGPDATVNTLLDRWWQTRAKTWSPSTAARYQSALDAHLRPHFGPMTVRKVRPEDVDAFLAASTMSPASLAKLRGILRAAFAQAVRWHWIARNPVDNAATVTVRRPEIVPPSPADVRKLIDIANDPKRGDPDWAMFIRLDAVTGARRSELCGLRWDDLDGDQLTIRRGIVRATGNRYVVRPTTKSHRARKIPLDAETVALLKTHRTRCAQRALACGTAAGGYIFSYEPDGSRPWHPNSVTQRWRRLRAKAGLETVRLHDVRHYVATRLLDAGIPAATVAQRLGHANERVTQTIYSHPVTERAVAAADTAATVLGDG